jgi:diaminopimelate epimerase
MSGNGIRCLAQAEVMRRGTDTVDLRVETDAGLKIVQVRPGGDARTIVASVDMGPARPTDPPADGGAALKVAGVDMGNPHDVRLYGDRALLDTDADALRAGAANVELVIAGPEPDAITMRVVERGVGETFACGTGACAAAWAAREWGLVGDHVTVHMPGGAADVDLADTITLTGPAVFVATVELPWR